MSLEWIGGHFPLPGVVGDAAEPYHAEVVLWFELPTGVIVGHDLVRTGELAGAFAAMLQECLRKPAVGEPRRPNRVRVGTEAIAAEVRGVLGGKTEVIVGATHEIDLLAADFQAAARRSFRPASRKEGSPAFANFTSGSYLQGGLVPPESVEELFRGAQLLNALAPWESIRDRKVLRLDIPPLDVHGAVVSILSGEECGFVVLPDFASTALLTDAEDADEEPFEPGAPILAFLLLPLEDLPTLARHEIERFKWEAIQSRYPWVERRERDGSLVPVDRRNIEIVEAVAWTLGTFCTKAAVALSGKSAEPVSMSIETSDRATVRYTFPYESFEEFAPEPDLKPRPERPRRSNPRQEPPAPPILTRTVRAAKVGRNDPCPCGSGRKYKHCHLEADEAGVVPPGATGSGGGQVAGVELVEVMRTFADDHLGAPWRRHTRDFRDADAAKQLAREWSVFHFEVDGQTAAAAFEARVGSRFSPLQKQWLAAQREAWLSVWEILEAHRGRGFTARDLLSGEKRTIQDVRASESAKPRDSLLMRVVQWQGRSEIWGLHPRPLTPRAASHVVDAARRHLHLGSEGLASPETLRAQATGRYLIRRWELAVERMDEERLNPPHLTTTDGESVILCTVVYDFDPADRSKVAAVLAAMPDAVPPETHERRAGRDWTYTFSRVETPSKAATGEAPRTVLGVARLGNGELRLETNSRERCARFTGQLSKAAGQLLRERERSEVDVREEYLKELRDPTAPAQVRLPKPEPVPPPEVIELSRKFKREYYRSWLDESIPALDGKTPRQAARLARSRRQLDLLLRDMENRESRQPEWDRFDFTELREELGLEP